MMLTIHAKPCAREESIEQMNETEFRIAVKEPPEKGKANKRIVQLWRILMIISCRIRILQTEDSEQIMLQSTESSVLAKKFKVLSKNVSIKNQKSRIKRVVIKTNQ